jgi:predicted membrane protein (TIGR00267 family)
MAERVAQDRDLMLRTLAEKELGLSPDVEVSPVKDAAAIGTSYIVGGILPLIPYFILEGVTAVLTSVAVAVSALFAMGAVKARFTRRNPILSGLEIMAIGAGVAAAGYGLGLVFPSP